MSLQLVPLHPAQLDVFLDQAINPQRPNYNVVAYISIKGELNVHRFRHVLNNAADVFDVFRLRFNIDDEEPVAYVAAVEVLPELKVIDCSAEEDPAAMAQQWMQGRADEPFIVQKDRMLFEHALVQLGEKEYYYFFKVHHLIFDGYCWRIWAKYLSTCYRAAGEDTYEIPAFEAPSYLEEVKKAGLTYKSDNYRFHAAYWQEMITEDPAGLLQRHYTRSGSKSAESGSYLLTLRPVQREMLEKLAATTNVRLPHLTLAAVLIYLAGITDRKEFVLGTPAHKRKSPQQRNTVGMFTGVVPFKGVYQPDQKLIDLIRNIAAAQKADYEHVDYLIGDLARHLRHDALSGPLLEMIVNYVLLDLDLDFGVDIATDFQVMFSQYQIEPLRMIWWDYTEKQSLVLRFDFRYEYFTEEEIGLLAQRIMFILEQFPAMLEHEVKEVAILPPGERSLVNTLQQVSQLSYPTDRTVAEVFSIQAAATPDATALLFEDTSLSYAELDAESNRLAAYLLQLGVEAESLVPVCLDRSADLLITLLGILKAGAAFVPLDPRYPQERIREMLSDTGYKIAITSSEYRDLFDSDAQILTLDALQPLLGLLPATSLPARGTADSLAYVMFTSGSTGRPKGVMVTQRNIVSLALGSGFLEWSASDVLLSTGSPSFDASTIEYWGTLLNGATLVLCAEDRLLDSAQLKEEINERSVTRMWFTAGWLNQLVDTDISVFASLKTVMAGGEKLSETHISRLRTAYPDLKIINGYGPTENTTFSLTYSIDTVTPGMSIPIGYPLSNRTAYVLDSRLQQLPIGIPGELYVGGAGLSRGYLGQPELTAARFITHPINGERLYRTGDLARLLPDGSIAYLGRTDDQVKLRGFRIELGEIESVLLGSGLVSRSVVILRDDSGTKRLLAYVVPETNYDEAEMLSYLSQRLPDYMIPAAIITLEAFPLTNNGKVDKRALPDPEEALSQAERYVSPRNEIETQLVYIWQEALQVERIGIHDDFFRLGGDSIRAIGVISQLRKRFGENIRLYDLYQSGNIAMLGALIENLQPIPTAVTKEQDLVKATIADLREKVLHELPDATGIEDIYPMSDIQSGMIYSSLWQSDKSVYHDQITFSIATHPDMPILEKALTLLTRKHAILRTVFDQHPLHGGIQIVYQEAKIKLDILDLQHVTKEEEQKEIQQYLAKERGIGFELNNTLLWRVAVLHMQQSCYLVFQFHHAMLDGWSLASLTTELNSVYMALLAGHDQQTLPSLKATYKDFVMEGILEKNNVSNQAFWQSALDGYRRPDIFMEEAVSHQLVRAYDKATFERLQQRTQSDQLSLRGLFLGITLYVAGMLTYEEELTIGVVTNNRPLLEDGDKVLGCFLNTIPFRRINNKQSLSWIAYFRQIEQQLLQLKERERISLSAITGITGESATGGNPFFDILFNFVNFHVYDDLQEGLFRQGHVAGGEDGPMSMIHELTNTFLDFCISTTGNNLLLICKMNRQLKSGKSLEDLAGYFDKIITAYLDHAEEQIDREQLWSAEEQQLLSSFNNESIIAAETSTLTAEFYKQVSLTPDATALIFEDITLTYRELDEQAGKLAAWLRSEGIKQQSLVPVCLDRSPEMVISILAILKTGSAYVPLDPAYPVDRMAYILKDVNSSLVVSSKLHAEKLRMAGATDILVLDDNWEEIIAASPLSVRPASQQDALAYVIYTSGSTGQPKGVLATHRPVISLIRHQSKKYGITPDERILLCANYCFDPSVEQLFFALLNGAAVVICREESIQDPQLLETLLEVQAITHLEATPGLIEHLTPGTYRALKRVICGGEVCKKELAEKWCGLLDFYNIYGPTETTISAVVFHCQPSLVSKIDTVPIGRPLTHAKVYILDKQGKPVPVGVVGELYIGGAGVTRGYLNRPALTDAVFLPDPFNTLPGARMYKTGDLGRWLPDGNIEYVGRIDNQLKLHGYRIELDEIVQVLLKSGWVSQAVVLDRKEETGLIRLCAYVVLSEKVDNETLRTYLSASLPAYMVPAVFCVLDTLPLTPNGKIDRTALKAIALPKSITTEYVAPRTATEQQLWEIWQQLLPVDRIGVFDDFFELGGHSLLAMRMNAYMKKALGVSVPVKKLFQCRCIARLAEYMDVADTRSVQRETRAAARIIEI